MWSDIGNNLQIFEVYKDHIKQDDALKLVQFEVFEELQRFAVYTIKKLTHVGKFSKTNLAYAFCVSANLDCQAHHKLLSLNRNLKAPHSTFPCAFKLLRKQYPQSS